MLTQPGTAQVTTGFSGYIVDLPTYQRVAGSFWGIGNNLYTNLTRLRLRPVIRFGEFSRVSVAYEVDALYQNAPFTFGEVPDKTTRQTFSLRWQPVTEAHLTVVHFIDRLYFQREFEFGKIVLGRQRVAWGTGRVWNPTDLFNPINPASFEKIEKDGADLATVQFYLGNFSDLTVVVNPQSRLRKTNGGIRLRSNYRRYDVSLIGGYFDEQILFGGDFAGNLWSAGVRGEGIMVFNRTSLHKNYSRYILGIDYQFTGEIYGLLEYQHNGQGSRQKFEYDLQALFRGEIINLNQEYLFAQLTWQPYALLNTGVGYNANLVDGSGFFLLTATFSALEDLDVGVGALLTYGDPFSEYWYYADAIFLKGEFYF